jgi:hypothetical protein
VRPGDLFPGLPNGIGGADARLCFQLPHRPCTSAAMVSTTAVVGVGLGYSVTGALANAGGLDLAYWIGAALDAAALFTAWRVVPPAPPGRQDRLDVAGAVLLGAARCSSGGFVSPIRADTAQHRLRLRGTLVVAGLVLVPFSATSYLARGAVASLVRRTSHEFVLPLFPGVLLARIVQ